jgi:hypothetical protein
MLTFVSRSHKLVMQITGITERTPAAELECFTRLVAASGVDDWELVDDLDAFVASLS